MESICESSSCCGSIQSLENKDLNEVSSFKSISITNASSIYLSQISTSSSQHKPLKKSRLSNDAPYIGCSCQVF